MDMYIYIYVYVFKCVTVAGDACACLHSTHICSCTNLAEDNKPELSEGSIV